MILSEVHLNKLCNMAIEAATEAGKLIASYPNHDVTPVHKPGGDSQASQVVTEVDIKSQTIIVNILKPTLEQFDLALLTEESVDDHSRFEKDYFWCIDPLDGTLPFVEGVPGYSVSIALISRSGIPQIGVVYNPLTHTLFHAISGQGAFRSNKPWKMPLPDITSKKILTFHSDRSFLSNILFDDTMIELRQLTSDYGRKELKIVKQGGGVMNAIWTLEHPPACYFKFPKKGKGGGSLWDYAATTCIFNELGAPASDIHGHPLDLNRPDSTYMNHKGVLFASDPVLAKKIIEMVAKLRKTAS